jgi:hypothetical protein
MIRVMLFAALLPLGAALASCADPYTISQQSIDRGISNDIEEARRPAASNLRPVWPTEPPPVANGGYLPPYPPR